LKKQAQKSAPNFTLPATASAAAVAAYREEGLLSVEGLLSPDAFLAL
jgi:hypothetical protein